MFDLQKSILSKICVVFYYYYCYVFVVDHFRVRKKYNFFCSCGQFFTGVKCSNIQKNKFNVQQQPAPVWWNDR